MNIEAYSDAGEPSAADCTMDVIIFTNGTTPSPPEYGIAIWNSQGQCTFSSRTAPMVWSENYVTFNGTPGQYTGPNQSVSKLAIPLCCVGADTGDSTLNDGYKILYNAGIRMSGNTVCGLKAHASGITYPQSAGIIKTITPISLPVIDSSIYI
ncbi:DUF6453 family protein [Erwinia endophytica]|uniref:DUF6453 family protein n=1 Tax=Erwinia endophytica TaxID=1563158 RepID=UPI003B847C60